MDEALDPGLQLDEGAVVGRVGDAPFEAGSHREALGDPAPRVGFQLLHAQTDAAGLGIEADDLNGDLLADREAVGGVVDALPSDVG